MILRIESAGKRRDERERTRGSGQRGADGSRREGTGRGVDRAVEALEKMLLPAYKAESGDDFTRITLYPQKGISAMTREERIEACYQHCCLAYADNETMNNQSVRERFGLNKNQGTIASHIISDTLSKGLIKSANPESESRKFVSYVPFYA